MRISWILLLVSGCIAGMGFSSLAQAKLLTPGIGTGASLQGFAAPRAKAPHKSLPPPAPGNSKTHVHHTGLGVQPAHGHRPNQQGAHHVGHE